MRRKRKLAVVLLSGGLDSAVTLYIAKNMGFKAHALSFDYSQRHRREIASARKIANKAGVPISIMKIEFPWKNSALLNKAIDVPKNRAIANISKSIPSTYVPARNIIFLSIAAGFAESLKAQAIFIGANAIDFSGYPDCRPEFFESMNKTIGTGTKFGGEHNIKIVTPLLKKNKADIVKIGNRLKVPFKLTWSCYEGGKYPCLKCDSCILRKKGFNEAGIEDPLIK